MKRFYSFLTPVTGTKDSCTQQSGLCRSSPISFLTRLEFEPNKVQQACALIRMIRTTDQSAQKTVPVR